MTGLADFIKANTKNSQMEHGHAWDMLRFLDSTCKIYRPEKIAGKID